MTEEINVPVGELRLLRVDAHAFRLLRQIDRFGDVLHELLDTNELVRLTEANTALEEVVRYRANQVTNLRNRFDKPALSPLQIREQVENSWRKYGMKGAA
ncbi:hypothetical protein [Amycolatopsis pithecellobii]|uniref:Uncharacterized protein n=1 Tax=Amycolatopsis pithecellobii TaxID=664692 RepID=A0A6N7YRN9_9PSEU|nr:hypothetical protein [Amycolatopsis pithecellobii]MTD55695.1 hypothetical protein [Amycolatopsis pithecellobii]